MQSIEGRVQHMSGTDWLSRQVVSDEDNGNPGDYLLGFHVHLPPWAETVMGWTGLSRPSGLSRAVAHSLTQGIFQANVWSRERYRSGPDDGRERTVPVRVMYWG